MACHIFCFAKLFFLDVFFLFHKSAVFVFVFFLSAPCLIIEVSRFLQVKYHTEIIKSVNYVYSVFVIGLVIVAWFYIIKTTDK